MLGVPLHQNKGFDALLRTVGSVAEHERPRNVPGSHTQNTRIIVQLVRQAVTPVSIRATIVGK